MVRAPVNDGDLDGGAAEKEKVIYGYIAPNPGNNFAECRRKHAIIAFAGFYRGSTSSHDGKATVRDGSRC